MKEPHPDEIDWPEIRRHPPPRGARRAWQEIPSNMLPRYMESEARAWNHSPLAGALWEMGFRGSRAIAISDSFK